MLQVVTHLKSRRLQASASLFCGYRNIEIELKTLATRSILSVAAVAVLSVLPIPASYAASDDLIFTANVRPGLLKWPYDGVTKPSGTEGEGSWTYTVPGGMAINKTDGASQWTDVLQWGNSTVGANGVDRALGDANGAGSLRQISATDTPTLDPYLAALFQGQPAFTGGASLSSWDTGNVTHMGRMFTDAYQFNGDISSWDVRNVTDFASMFVRARAFDQDISGWVTESVVPEVRDRCFVPGEGDTQCNTTGMGAMFYGAINFDQDLSSWNVSAYSTTANAVREVDGQKQIAFGSTNEIGQGRVATPFTKILDGEAASSHSFFLSNAVRLMPRRT